MNRFVISPVQISYFNPFESILTGTQRVFTRFQYSSSVYWTSCIQYLVVLNLSSPHLYSIAGPLSRWKHSPPSRNLYSPVLYISSVICSPANDHKPRLARMLARSHLQELQPTIPVDLLLLHRMTHVGPFHSQPRNINGWCLNTPEGNVGAFRFEELNSWPLLNICTGDSNTHNDRGDKSDCTIDGGCLHHDQIVPHRSELFTHEFECVPVFITFPHCDLFPIILFTIALTKQMIFCTHSVRWYDWWASPPAPVQDPNMSWVHSPKTDEAISTNRHHFGQITAH